MTLSRALAEAYASGDEIGVVITTLEIDHPSLSVPIRLVQNVDSVLGEPGDTMKLPVSANTSPVDHLLCAFDLIPPGADEDGPTEGKVRVDNVSDALYDLLNGVVGYNESVLVTFRQYRVLPGSLGSVSSPDDDTYSGMELTNFDLTSDQAEGTVAWPDGRQQNVPTGPDAFFDRDTYPGLFS